MVDLGHFKELKLILQYIYSRKEELDEGNVEEKTKILGATENLLTSEEGFKVGPDTEGKDVDESKVVDLNEEFANVETQNLMLDDKKIIRQERATMSAGEKKKMKKKNDKN